MVEERASIVWEQPVYDRTQADVDYAITELADRIKRGRSVNPVLKGCLNYTDITRIEDNIKYLSDNLSELYYFPHTDYVAWLETDLLNIEDVNRIIGNVRKIISAYYQSPSAPELPITMLRFVEINSIEENLYLLKEMLDNMIASFRECGTFNCGED